MEARKQRRTERNKRLASLFGTGKVAAATIARLVDEVRTHPEVLEDLSHGRPQQTLCRAVTSQFNEVKHEIALPTKCGTWINWPVAAPCRLFASFSADCTNFRKLLQMLYDAKPCSPEDPWHLIIYFDETTPGNLLSLNNKRKTMGIYGSLREFGPAILPHEHAWLPLAVLRTSWIKQITGGFTTAVGCYMEHILNGPENVLEGVPIVDLDAGRPAFICFRMSNVLGDAEGLQKFWGIKGPNGTMPCLRCLNVCGNGARDLVPFDRRGQLVDISEHRRDRIHHAENKDVWDKADALAAVKGVIRATDFSMVETACGMNYIPTGVLWRPALRECLKPVDVHTYDPTHTFLADGSMNTEVDFCLRRLGEHGITFELLSNQIAAYDWHFPHFVSASKARLADMLSRSKRDHFYNDQNHKLSLGPSEMLMFVPVLAHTLEDLALPDLALETKSLSCCNGALRAYMAAKRGEPAAADRLHAALDEWADAYAAAYRTEPSAYKPKWHFQFDIVDQIRRDGMALDAFVGERKQSCLKTASEFIENASTKTMSYELSTLARFIELHKARMQEVFALNPNFWFPQILLPTRPTSMLGAGGNQNGRLASSTASSKESRPTSLQHLQEAALPN